MSDMLLLDLPEGVLFRDGDTDRPYYARIVARREDGSPLLSTERVRGFSAEDLEAVARHMRARKACHQD